MTDRWTDRWKTQRGTVAESASALSASARAAAEGASERVGRVYGQVRDRAVAATVVPRESAGHLLEQAGTQAGELARRGRAQIDRAAIASRGLVAERPLTAVAIGVGAGLILGLLANRLGRQRSEATHADVEADEQS